MEMVLAELEAVEHGLVGVVGSQHAVTAHMEEAISMYSQISHELKDFRRMGLVVALE